LVDRFPVVSFLHRGPICHKLPKSTGNDRFDGIIECRVCGKLQVRCPDRQWAVICRQHEAALGLAHYFKPQRQSVSEANRQLIERRFFAGLQFQFNFRQWLLAIADNNEPFIESHLDQGPFEIEATQTPLDLRLKLPLERASLDDAAQLGGRDIGVPPPYGPMDFAGWFEAYLGGRWYTFDARNNMPRIGRVLIAQGRDAADVPITHTFGPNTLVSFKVWTDEVS
jgi:hypothetical protein